MISGSELLQLRKILEAKIVKVEKMIGPRGEKGDKGDAGKAGPKGDTGSSGKDGNDGKDGKDCVCPVAAPADDEIVELESQRTTNSTRSYGIQGTAELRAELARLTNITEVSGDYTVIGTDGTILVDTTAAAVTVTLPVAEEGRKITVKKIAGINTLTLASTDNIDDSATQLVGTTYTAVQMHSDGTTWWII